MSDKTSIGDRFKAYEQVPSTKLMRRVPVVLRLDGKAFSTLTRGMEKPLDWEFVECMATAAVVLCQEAVGAQLAYIQSDEISVLLTDYRTYATQPWFNYRVQKLCSVAASTVTAAFNAAFTHQFPGKTNIGLFDCRAFNLSRAEVVNYFIWRQQDATRNSIQSLGQAHFSHKQLHKKSTSDVQDMLMEQHGINWNDCPVIQKRGLCVVRKEHAKRQHLDEPVYGSDWEGDSAIPIFSKDREYIQKLVDVEEEE